MSDDREPDPWEPDWYVSPGETIREAIAERGWNQRELADMTGLSPFTVSRLLNARAPLTADKAIVLGAALGINPRVLMRLEADYRLGLERDRARGRR